MTEDLTNQIGEYVLQQIKQMANEQVKNRVPKIVTVDVKALADMTHMSVSYLRDSVIDTPEFLAIEADVGRKRLWFADKVPGAWTKYLTKHGVPGRNRLPQSIRKEAIL